MSDETEILRLPALQINQGEKTIYSFSVDGKKLPEFTTISRIARDDDAKLTGYQRTESRKHTNDIRNYIESEDPMLPNSLVVAFDERVKFEPLDDPPSTDGYSRHGWLIVPVDQEEEVVERPGWIVDGQQRLAAIRKADIEAFPVSVTAFITSSIEEQREQFILVNSTKTVKRSLIYELLPGTDTELPKKFRKKKFPSRLLARLNHDDDSPFKGKIKTPTTHGGIIKDNSVLKMLINSLKDGALYYYRDPKTGERDVEKMLELVKNYWAAVAEVFPKAWNLKARKSRLTHGAGITAMGFVMDAIVDTYRWDYDLDGIPTVEQFQCHLEPLAEYCSWTDGYWEFDDGKREWNDLQNLAKDIRPLTNFLLGHYRQIVEELDAERTELHAETA